MLRRRGGGRGNIRGGLLLSEGEGGRGFVFVCFFVFLCFFFGGRATVGLVGWLVGCSFFIFCFLT